MATQEVWKIVARYVAFREADIPTGEWYDKKMRSINNETVSKNKKNIIGQEMRAKVHKSPLVMGSDEPVSHFRTNTNVVYDFEACIPSSRE